MQPRETKTLTTPLGKELVIKTYLTARELRAVETATLKLTKIGIEDLPGEGMRKSLKDFDAAAAANAEDDELITQSVVSYDGPGPQTVLDRLLDEQPQELAFVLAEAKLLLPTDPTVRK